MPKSQTEHRLLTKELDLQTQGFESCAPRIEVRFVRRFSEASETGDGDRVVWRVEPLWSSVAGSARSVASGEPNVKLYRTDLQGEITITTRGKDNDMTVKPAKETTEDLWAGRTAQKDDSSRSGFIAYGDFGPPPRPKEE